MSVIHAIILGIIQGITEFLPVSSFGHLCAVQDLLDVTSGHHDSADLCFPERY